MGTDTYIKKVNKGLEPLDVPFSLVDYEVQIYTFQHNPTGERFLVGYDELMTQPVAKVLLSRWEEHSATQSP